MRNITLLCGIFLGLSVSLLRAGTVVTIADGSEVTGKLTLNPSAIHVEASSPTDINLPDILEAVFGDAPFELNNYSSIDDDPNKLPADWKAQDIGQAKIPGSLSYAAGTFTMTGVGSAVDRKENEDQYFFVGRQWTGNGQWTVRVGVMDAESQGAEAGLMLRDSLDPGSIMFGLGAFGLTQSKGLFHYRNNAGEHSQWGGDFPLDLPAWVRLTRNGSSVDGAISSDGKKWQNIGHYDTKVSADPWVGLWVNSRNDNATAKVMLDQVTFTPPPCSAQILPPGVWLRSGSFVAGTFDALDFDPTHPDANGRFNRNGKNVDISPSVIAAVTMQPMARSEIASLGSQVGLVMKNGDFSAGDFQAINGGGARMSSLVLGIVNYDRSQVGACVLHPMDPQPADYEIRLRDGSIVRATSLGVNNGQLVIGDVAGVAISVDAGEIAQVRAGSSRVQSLLDLPWTATPLPVPAPAPNVAPAVTAPPGTTNAAAGNAAPPAPAANAAPAQAASAQCWEGPDQEQVMVVPVETVVDFPLTGKFRALALRIALSSDSPPNAQAAVRVLVDGREVGRTPPMKSGDQPRFVEVTLQDPRSVTLVADSPIAGTRVLFIDPVVIRESEP